MQNEAINKLIEKRVIPAIKDKLTARNEAVSDQKQLAGKIDKYEAAAAADRQECESIQGLLHEEIENGLSTTKSLKELEVKKGSMEAHERLVKKLREQNDGAIIAEVESQNHLDRVFREAVTAIRGEIENTVKGLLVDALGVLVSFEAETLKPCREQGIEPGREFERDAFRFLELDKILTDIGFWCSPIGGGSSMARRRKLIAEWPKYPEAVSK